MGLSERGKKETGGVKKQLKGGGEGGRYLQGT